MTTWLNRALVVAPCLTLCLSEREYLKVLREFKQEPNGPWVMDGADATMHTLERKGKDDVCIVCLRAPAGIDPVSVAGLLVHEAVHIWQKVRRGINEHDPSPEFEAYSVQSIAQQLMWEYARRMREA